MKIGILNADTVELPGASECGRRAEVDDLWQTLHGTAPPLRARQKRLAQRSARRPVQRQGRRPRPELRGQGQGALRAAGLRPRLALPLLLAHDLLLFLGPLLFFLVRNALDDERLGLRRCAPDARRRSDEHPADVHTHWHLGILLA